MDMGVGFLKIRKGEWGVVKHSARSRVWGWARGRSRRVAGR
ncbi:MAG: hypothetical protein ACAF42_01320 [Limnothrix sp. BL-A-16]